MFRGRGRWDTSELLPCPDAIGIAGQGDGRNYPVDIFVTLKLAAGQGMCNYTSMVCAARPRLTTAKTGVAKTLQKKCTDTRSESGVRRPIGPNDPVHGPLQQLAHLWGVGGSGCAGPTIPTNQPRNDPVRTRNDPHPAQPPIRNRSERGTDHPRLNPAPIPRADDTLHRTHGTDPRQRQRGVTGTNTHHTP